MLREIQGDLAAMNGLEFGWSFFFQKPMQSGHWILDGPVCLVEFAKGVLACGLVLRGACVRMTLRGQFMETGLESGLINPGTGRQTKSIEWVGHGVFRLKSGEYT